MSVHRVPPIPIEPETVLSHYRVFELPEGSRHFCGYVAPDREGRVSSQITSWDPETRTGTTMRGRRYRLEGEAGFDPDAEYVWDQWKRINAIDELRDVTEDYAPHPVPGAPT